MTMWILLTWLCVGQGDCRWILVSHHPTQAECLEATAKIARYSECVKMTVPAPGRPGK